MLKVTRILFIADKHPCPPINGLYVPLYELIQRMHMLPDISLELALPVKRFHERLANHDQYFKKIHYFPLKSRSRMKKFFDLILFRSPSYTKEMCISSMKLAYDVVIATPDGYIGTLRVLQKASLANFSILWLNELYYTVPLGQLRNLLPLKFKQLPYAIYLSMKYGMIYLHEKRYLSWIDAIVVQTKVEEERFNVFRSSYCKTQAFICSNPIKEQLLTHLINDDSKVILIHAPRSVDEISFFVHEISDYMQTYKKNVLLRICVQNSLIYKRALGSLYNVEILDYQDNIADVYQGVFCALVLTKQRFGLVNRVKEGMTAGLPVIAFPETLQTVGAVLDKVHAVYAMNEQEFVLQTIKIMNDRELAVRIGIDARQFVIENEKYGPGVFIEQLFAAIKQKKVEVSV